MGCISSKSSTDQQPDDPVIIRNHQFESPSNTNHIVDALELIPQKHDDSLIIQTNLKTDDTLERCSSFHTVEEYDKLLQRISSRNDAETTDSCKNDGNNNIEKGDEKKQDIEFQTVASLRQWLHGSRRGDANAATTDDHTTPKVGFSFYENNGNKTQGAEEDSILVKTGKQEEDENIVDLVAAFDKYMQQLQIDEDNILQTIHNMVN